MPSGWQKETLSGGRNQAVQGEWQCFMAAVWGTASSHQQQKLVGVKIPVLTQVGGTWTELWIATWKPWPCFQVLCACCWCFLCIAVSCAFCIVWESAAHWYPPYEFCISFLQLGRTEWRTSVWVVPVLCLEQNFPQSPSCLKASCQQWGDSACVAEPVWEPHQSQTLD